MTLRRARTDYLAALKLADHYRAHLADAIERERDAGRLLEDIGADIGLSKSGVSHFLRRARAGGQTVAEPATGGQEIPRGDVNAITE